MTQTQNGACYLVRRYFRNDRPGLYGWDCRDESFQTEAAARSAFEAPFARGQFKSELLHWDGRKGEKLAERGRWK